MQEGCKKILVSDYFNLFKRLVKTQQKGVSVSEEMVCGACHRILVEKDVSRVVNITVFNCKHAFHEHCMPQNLIKCGICYPVDSE